MDLKFDPNGSEIVSSLALVAVDEIERDGEWNTSLSWTGVRGLITQLNVVMLQCREQRSH